MAIWFTDRGIDQASWVSGSIAIVLFLVFEFMIRLERVNVTDDGIVVGRGIFKKSVTRLSYYNVYHVSVIQTVLQKVLRFGSVKIDSPGSEIVLLDFQDPAKIEKAISIHIHKMHSTHSHHAGRPHVGP